MLLQLKYPLSAVMCALLSSVCHQAISQEPSVSLLMKKYRGEAVLDVVSSKGKNYLLVQIIYNVDEPTGQVIPVSRKIPQPNEIVYTEDMLERIDLPPIYLDKNLFIKRREILTMSREFSRDYVKENNIK